MALTPLKISAMTAASVLSGAEMFPIVQGGNNRRTSPTDLMTFMGLNEEIEVGVWTPVVTFQTPGDLSVAYVDQAGIYTKLNNFIQVAFQLRFTLTYTTSAGEMRIEGLPVSINVEGVGSCWFSGAVIPAFPAGCTMVNMRAVSANQNLQIAAVGSATASAMSVTQYPSGATSWRIRGECVYETT